MALTTKDLGQIKGVVDGAVLSSEQRVTKHIDSGLAGLDAHIGGLDAHIVGLDARMVGLEAQIVGLEVQMNDGFEQVIATIDGHMVETDRRFMS